jgi:putative transposon-encoded protein
MVISKASHVIEKDAEVNFTKTVNDAGFETKPYRVTT